MAAHVLALGQIMGLQATRVQQILQEGFGKEAQRLCRLKAFCSYWQQLNKDFAEFQKKIQDVDRRLATIFCQGFDDCNCLASAVKVHVPPQLDGSCPRARGVLA